MATRLSTMTIRIIGACVAVAVVVGLIFYFLSSAPTRSVTAQFDSGVGIYNGTPVKIRGVQVGSVTKVTAKADAVYIKMNYDAKYHVPNDVDAVMVANSLVSDRYIQLTWSDHDTNPRLASGATIPQARTASPAELDDIYSALAKLTTSLGPNGANKTGALSQLINVSSANLQGNGKALGNSITALSQAVQTLANGRGDLFQTVQHLRTFNQALVNSDKQVAHFEEQLAQVSGELAAERSDLGAALHNLTIAIHQVAVFVNQNANRIHTDVHGLGQVIGVLVKEQAALNETLSVAPIALANIVHAYQEQSGTLGTRSNLGGLGDPAIAVCDTLQGITTGGLLGTLLNGIPAAIPTDLVNACKKVLTLPGSSAQAQSSAVNSVLGNGLLAPGGSN
jgi:phospholipid/cholesterol/gamma-HCH transport system substrate-binding protein